MTILSRLAELQNRLGQARSIVLTCLLVSLISLTPLLMTKILPLGDLVFHMARMKILENPSAPYIRDWFQPNWTLLPNLALDLIVPGLSALVGVEAATKIFVALTLVLLMTGTLALHHSLYRKLSWFPLSACLFLYNFILFFGFMNYLFGVGLLLWALAGWFWSERSTLALRVLIGTISALALYVAHLYSLGLFGVLIATSELRKLIDRKTLERRDILQAIAATTLPFLLPLALLLKSRLAAVATESSALGVHYGLSWKLFALPTLLITDNLPIDLILTAGIGVIALILLFRRAIEIARPLQLGVIAMIGLIILLPSTIAGTGYVEARLPAAAIFIVIGACRIRIPLCSSLRTGLAAGVACLFALRILALLVDFSLAGRATADITAQYAKLAPGSVLFEGSLERKQVMWPWDIHDYWRPLWQRQNMMPLSQLTTTAILYQPVFVPETLLADGQQPVRITPAFRQLKALQDTTGDNSRWLADDAALRSWLEEIRSTMRSSSQRFSAVYVTLIGPAERGTLPRNVVELFSNYRYRIWDISAYIAQ